MHRIRTTGLALLLLVLMVAVSGGAKAAPDGICTTLSDGNWNTAARWSCTTGAVNRVPNSGDSVVIAHNITLNTSTTIINLTINNTKKLTGSNGSDLTLTGDWTLLGSGWFAHNGTDLSAAGSDVTFAGTSLQTITLGTGSIHIDTLTVNVNAIVKIPDVDNNDDFSAQTVLNYGVLQQTRLVADNSNVEFLRIRDCDSGSSATNCNGNGTDVYKGMKVKTPSGTGNLTMTVSIAGEHPVCTNPDAGLYRNRCYRLYSPSAVLDVEITLKDTTLDEDDITNDSFFQFVNGSWVDQGVDNTNCSGTDGKECKPSGKKVDLVAGDNFFLIGSSANPPTPVVLTSFQASPSEAGITVTWQTASETDFAGFYLWHAGEAGGSFERISPFIVAKGGPTTGASYEYLDNRTLSGLQSYRLEAVDLDNSSEFFDATVQAQSSTPNATIKLFLPMTGR